MWESTQTISFSTFSYQNSEVKHRKSIGYYLPERLWIFRPILNKKFHKSITPIEFPFIINTNFPPFLQIYEFLQGIYLYGDQFKVVCLNIQFHKIKIRDQFKVVCLNITYVSKKLNMPNPWVGVVGSCNGLVLMLDIEDRMFLVNPVTREQVSIPHRPSYAFTEREYRLHGFGYDSFNHDYKIVTIAAYKLWNNAVIVIDVYSIKTGIWTSKYDLSGLSVADRAFGALVNGRLHWCTNSSVVSFDLASEEFLIIPRPTNIVHRSSPYKAFSLGSHLCIVQILSSADDIIDAWIMEEYGVPESWINFSLCVDGLGSSSARPLCYVRQDDEKGVLLNLMNMLYVSHLKEQTKKPLLVNRAVTAFQDGCVFVESLVSPRQPFLTGR